MIYGTSSKRELESFDAWVEKVFDFCEYRFICDIENEVDLFILCYSEGMSPEAAVNYIYGEMI